ncbi:pseudouridine synthase [Ammoniphilus oxalaticus]|uniref:Pseudouridine synthase n=1 Tax=Ammoniphilus oxalaticus TaxID=66863 RepID=A0A419SN35_9BACL|nr:pseudouridine synthase [Ammoniphilus oxalaticus]RKD25663.1 pseudouridine synthase [Ammoniphilus oxalaticus]
MEERLQKILAGRGVASRRKCEALIVAGRVKVNGQTVTELGFRADPVRDRIELDGKPIKSETLRYVLFHKPKGVITSVTDPQGRKTVIDCIDLKERIYPVGRLDYDTSGLLLLTNDGDLTNRLTHPSFEIEKTYEATVRGLPRQEALESLRKGVLLEDGMTAPAQAKLLRAARRAAGSAVIQLTIHEGRNRQVRRMCEAVGHPALELKRTQFAFLTLGHLQPGKYRLLNDAEVNKLREL